MLEMKFTEEDKQKFVDFLNTVAKTAKFEFKTEELINYFKLLAHMQTQILPKLDANIMEITKIVDNKDLDKKKTSKTKAATAPT